MQLETLESCFRAAGSPDEHIAYLRYHWDRYRLTKERFEEGWTRPHGGTRVLDLGCHVLHQTLLWKLDGYDVIGADLDWVTTHPAVAETARRYAIPVFPYRDLSAAGSLAQVPDGSVDVVLFCEILEHITFNPIPLWREVHRILRPGGRIVVTTPNYYHAHGRAWNRHRVLARMGGGAYVEEILQCNTTAPHWKEYAMREVQRYFRLLSPDFRIHAAHYELGHYPIPSATLRDRVLAALQRRFRVLRHNLYVEVAMDAKAAGIVIQPGWAFPTNISFHVP